MGEGSLATPGEKEQEHATRAYSHMPSLAGESILHLREVLQMTKRGKSCTYTSFNPKNGDKVAQGNGPGKKNHKKKVVDHERKKEILLCIGRGSVRKD